MHIVNRTPFVAATVLALGADAAETLAVIIKATYDLRGPRPRPCEEQAPIQVADEYGGDPAASSLRYASDRPLHKPATDVLLVGSAYADRSGCRTVDVQLRVGPVAKTVRVFGDRHWLKSLGSTFPSDPARFERVPLVFERAFGGVDETTGDRVAANPAGVGFRGRHSRKPVERTALPNLEDPRAPIRSPTDRPTPAGFGFIAPHWEPRAQLSGTFDARWLERHAPLLPLDYDPRFQQAAPADQVCAPYLRGGEPVEVRNASPHGRLAFALPAPRITVELQIAGDAEALPVNLDTVVIDGDRERLFLTWRGSRAVHGQVHELEVTRIDVEDVA